MSKVFGIVAAFVVVMIIVLGLVVVIHRRRENAQPALPDFGTSTQVLGNSSTGNVATPPSSTGNTVSQTSTPSPTVTPSSASSYKPGSYNESIVTADGRTRTYILHIPTGYSPSTSYPLVLLYHGGGGTAQKILDQTNFAAKADEAGFILVAPDSTPGTNWADGRGTTDADKAGVDDVAFTQQLISSLESKLPIDKDRIYATGASNGGIMVERLGCELSSVLAAIGPDVGPIATPIAPQCSPSPIAVMGIQGGADPLVPIGGGDVKGGTFLGAGGPVESAAFTMNLWASADGCNLTPTVTNIPPTVSDSTSVTQYSYSGCTAGTTVVYDIVQGMGHDWPPTAQAAPRLTGPASQNINATDVMWAFFSQHSR